jgi:hypothetical protein
MTPDQLANKAAQVAVITTADKILTAAETASKGDVYVAIMACLVAAASLARTEDMGRAAFIDGAKLAYDNIHGQS